MDIGCLQDLYATRDADVALREFHAFVQVQVLYEAAEGPLTSGVAWCVTRVSVLGARTLTRIGAFCVCLLGVSVYIYMLYYIYNIYMCVCMYI